MNASIYNRYNLSKVNLFKKCIALACVTKVKIKGKGEKRKMLYINICEQRSLSVDLWTSLILDAAQRNQIEVVCSKFKSGEQLLFDIEDTVNVPDIIFMSMELPGISGLDVIKILRSRGYNSEVVFISEDTKYAFDSFKIQPLNYLVKGDITPKKFEQVFLKAVKYVEEKKAGSMSVICLNDNSNRKTILLVDVLYFHISHRVISVYYKDGTSDEFYKSMSELELELSSRKFMRLHRSFLVNFRYIKRIENKKAILLNGEELPVGASYRKSIREGYFASLPYVIRA
jgi:two-component system response regulator LytT